MTILIIGFMLVLLVNEYVMFRILNILEECRGGDKKRKRK